MQGNWLRKGLHKRYKLGAKYDFSMTMDAWLDQNKVKIDQQIEYAIVSNQTFCFCVCQVKLTPMAC